MRVLVIDDNENVRELLVALLGKNYEVTQAESGEAGVARALQTPPDIVLCDLFMAGMGGEEVIQQLRIHVETARIPVVLMSGRERQGTTEDTGVEFLQKPFQIHEVSAVIERVLAGRR